MSWFTGDRSDGNDHVEDEEKNPHQHHYWKDISSDEYNDNDPNFKPLDPELKIFRSSHELAAELLDKPFKQKDRLEPVTFADIDKEMKILRQEQVIDEAMQLLIEKTFEDCMKKSLSGEKDGGGKEATKLEPVLVAKIASRLTFDPALQVDEYENPINGMDNPALTVRRKMVRTMDKLLQNDYEHKLSQATKYRIKECTKNLRMP